MRQSAIVLALALAAGAASADTTQLDDHIYAIDEGVAITLGNVGADDFLFNWSDDSGDFTDIVDPTLVLTAGQTYTFQRVTPAHPFVITDDTMSVDGMDGFYFRLTTDGAVIDDATLKPIDDFTADPGPTDDLITWTPSLADVGDYWYTCRVVGHVGMTGRIQVVPAPGAATLLGLATVGLVRRRR